MCAAARVDVPYTTARATPQKQGRRHRRRAHERTHTHTRITRLLCWTKPRIIRSKWRRLRAIPPRRVARGGPSTHRPFNPGTLHTQLSLLPPALSAAAHHELNEQRSKPCCWRAAQQGCLHAKHAEQRGAACQLPQPYGSRPLSAYDVKSITREKYN